MDEFNLTNEKKITQKEWEEFKVFKEEYQENEAKRNFLLQQQNDILSGGIRSANLKEYRNTYVINAQDSLDDSYPMYVHFNIISEMVRIVSIKLSFWLLNFRAYSTGAKSGGGTVETTSEGGGQTTSSGGSSTPTTSDGGSANPTSSSGGGQTSSSGGGHYHAILLLNSTTGNIVYYDPAQTQTQRLGRTGGGVIYTSSADPHTHTVSNHTHTVSIPNHTHTVTIDNHTHTVSNHTHTVTIADHDHTVTIEDHSHDITYGIHEEENSPTIVPSISRDNGLTYSLPIGSYTKDQELDITRFIDTRGSKIIKFTSNTRTRLSVQVTVKLDIKAR